MFSLSRERLKNEIDDKKQYIDFVCDKTDRTNVYLSIALNHHS
jgi:hypothetical protein